MSSYFTKTNVISYSTSISITVLLASIIHK